MHLFLRRVLAEDGGEEDGHAQADNPLPQERELMEPFIPAASEQAASEASDFYQRQAARVEVFSWNVGSLADERSKGRTGIDEQFQKDISALLAGALGVGSGAGADVIVVGLQEVLSFTVGNAARVLTHSALDGSHNSLPETVVHWVELLRKTINTGTGGRSDPGTRLYVLYGQPVLYFGLLLCVFCLPELVGTHIQQFGAFEMRAGEGYFAEGGRLFPSKGVVACRFSLYDRSFCFINCHLASDTSRKEQGLKQSLKDREAQLVRCCQGIEFRLNDQQVYPLAAHRAVFLLGDTNMRLSKPDDGKSLKSFHEDVDACIKSKNWAKIRGYDQLQQILQKGILAGELPDGETALEQKKHTWQEPDVHFPPTFKLKLGNVSEGEDESRYNKKRIPAWCDRILHRSPDAQVKRYEAVEQSEVLDPPRIITDHNPVYALFEVECVRIKRGALLDLVRHHLSHRQDAPEDRLHHALHAEDARHFSWRFVNTGRPHMEVVARRIFEELCNEHDMAEVTAAADRVIETQQECWRLICEHLEEQISAAHRSSGSSPASPPLEERLRGASRDLSRSLSGRSSGDTYWV